MKRIIKRIGELACAGGLVYFVARWQQKCIDHWKEQAEKNRAMFVLMDRWASLRQDGRKLEEYFMKNEYGRIAVYGLGVMGQRLIKELRDSQVEVVYGIDKNEDMTYTGLDVIPIRGELPSVDAVVVTVVKEFETIREVLSKKLDCPVIAIEDILGVF